LICQEELQKENNRLTNVVEVLVPYSVESPCCIHWVFFAITETVEPSWTSGYFAQTPSCFSPELSEPIVFGINAR
jgi:hypothetical protein